MNNHLASLPHHGRNVRAAIELVDREGHIIEQYDTIFSELFCVAASALAGQMNHDLVDAGILWDEILSTGGHGTAGSISETSTLARSGGGSLQSIKRDLDDLAEKGAAQKKPNGHGHLMFLVRRIDSSHVDHLAAAGYCFAEPRHVAHMIRSKMQIRTNKLEDKFRIMERYARGAMLDAGVHVGLFAVRTQVHQMGFDVLVRRQARNLLPSMELPMDRLEPAHIEFLRRLDGMTMGALHRRLETANELPPRDAAFAGLLLEGIRNLRASVQDPAFDNAKLVAKVSQVPCTPPTNDARPSMCSFIAFTIMIPIHVRVDAPAYDFIPLPFFKTQQLVYKNSPHNAAFGRSVHRKISPILDSVRAESTHSNQSRMRDFITKPGFLFFSRSGGASARSRRADAVKLVSPSREHITPMPCDESVSSLPLYNTPGGESEHSSDHKTGGAGDLGSSGSALKPPARRQLIKKSYGGIMISQEVTVDVEEARDEAHDMPELPHASHRRDSYPASLARQRSQRGPPSSAGGGGPGGGSQNQSRFDQAIELKEVTTGLGMKGLSKVEVGKEGDDTSTTFVDDLFSSCIDTPRRI